MWLRYWLSNCVAIPPTVGTAAEVTTGAASTPDGNATRPGIYGLYIDIDIVAAVAVAVVVAVVVAVAV